MNEITQPQAEALARYLLTLRVDWSLVYCLPAVENMRLIDPDVERITRAAVRGALAKRNGQYVMHKPDPLAMNGEHWKARLDEVFEQVPPSAVDCLKCARTHMPSVDCVAEGWKRRKEDDTAASLEAARVELAAITADRCHHGTPRRFCVEHRETEEPS
jgi:hypothetical protein